MFAPKAAVSTTSLRNPRRRQRASSGESIKPPSAKRQRSILRQDDDSKIGDLTDRPLDHRSLVPGASTANNVEVTPNPDGETQRNIPIRTSKKSEIRKCDAVEPVILVCPPFFYYPRPDVLTLLCFSQRRISIPYPNYHLYQIKFGAFNRVCSTINLVMYH